MKSTLLSPVIFLAALSMILTGCNPSSSQSSSDSGTASSSGTDSVLAETNDSNPSAQCAKPDGSLLVSATGDDVGGGNIWITTLKSSGQIQSVPIKLSYVEYEFGALDESTGETPLFTAATYDWACLSTPSQEDETTATFQCNSPLETQPAHFQMTTKGGQYSANPQTVVFKNPSCDRQVTYQQQFVPFTGVDPMSHGLDSIGFPAYFNTDGS